MNTEEQKTILARHSGGWVPPEVVKLLLISEAPPLPSENYFYRCEPDAGSHGNHRSFFRGLMQGIGLLPVGVRRYSEEVLLKRFIEAGYWLIDACPTPLVDTQGEQLPSPKKRQILTNYVEPLAEAIERLSPEAIILLCSTTEQLAAKLEKRVGQDKLPVRRPLPYPGNGWLRRPKTKDGFIDLFPTAYRLAALY